MPSNNKKDQMISRGRSATRMNLEDLLHSAAEAESGQVAHPIEVVDIAWIVEDEDIQVRVGGLHKPTVQAYAEIIRAGGELPPIDLFRDRDDRLFLGDGFHRIEAHRLLKIPTITAYIWPGGFEAAYQHAEESNLKHGRPLSQADKYNLFVRRVTRGHTWIDGNSDRAIAQALGVGHQTVGRWWNQAAQDYPDNPHIQSDRKVVGADGRMYQTRTIRKSNRRRAVDPEKKTQQRVIHNLRNAINGLKKLGLDDDAQEIEAIANDLAATFE